MIKTQLVDARNFDGIAQQIIDEVKAAPFSGLDCETEDSARHEGLNKFCKYKEDGTKAKNTKLVFDFRRMNMTGFSIFAQDAATSYYVNLHHADVENRVPWEKARVLLDAKPKGSHWIAHNAPFELQAFKSCFDFTVPEIICTLQMAVSAYGNDEYNQSDWMKAGLGEMKRLLWPLLQASKDHDPDEKKFSGELSDLMYKITAKESDSAHSYNGFCDEISYGYGLKRAVKSFFNYDMKTFEETLGDKAHMGQLTGDDVAAYGADDAYWALRLFHHLLGMMANRSPDAIAAFFEQENPMVYHYADMNTQGLRVNGAAIENRRALERVNFANILRKMKPLILKTGGFRPEGDTRLIERETSWYATEKKPTNYLSHRKAIWDWANSRDSDNDFLQAAQVSGSVSKPWAEELGGKEPTGPNMSHYMKMRVILYDLLQCKLIVSDGKVQSDNDARGSMKLAFEKQIKAGANNLEEIQNKIAIIDCIGEIASLEQRMKLYLNPYTMLTDPDTNTLYPTISSQLVSRRMAASNPNPMQLAKRGESTYVRGFYLPDWDDHLIVSLDWSAIELLIIGELSGDPGFIKAYGQLPHDDMHAGAAADVLSVVVPGLDEDMFKALKKYDSAEDWCKLYGMTPEDSSRLWTNLKGEPMKPKDAYKYWRGTPAGKGANFNYWYSGWLATIGESFGWSMQQTATATEKYRDRFSVAEAWRVEQINHGKIHGFVQLPDGHRRYRFEALGHWPVFWEAKWQPEDRGFKHVVENMGRQIHRRAGNQLVNSLVQGTCSTIAKRSVIRIIKEMRARGWTNREGRFMIPIHDELVFSIHHSLVPEFITMARGIMIDHPELFKLCKLDATPAVGVTFEPFERKKAKFGQMEVFEAPPLDWIPEAEHFKKMSADTLNATVQYLHANRGLAMAA